MRLLAGIAAEREDYVEAEALLGQCLRLTPGYSHARFDLARILHSQQKAEPMLPLLERLLALEPQNLHYRTLLADAYNVLGQNEQALQILAALLAELPDNEWVWLYYGHSLRTAGHPQEAIAAYRRATHPAGFGQAGRSETSRPSASAPPPLPSAPRWRARTCRQRASQFQFALARRSKTSGFARLLRPLRARQRTAARRRRLRPPRVPRAWSAAARCMPARILRRAPMLALRRIRFSSSACRARARRHRADPRQPLRVEGTRELPDAHVRTRARRTRRPRPPGAVPAAVARLRRELTALGGALPRADADPPSPAAPTSRRAEQLPAPGAHPSDAAAHHRCAAAPLAACLPKQIFSQPRGSAAPPVIWLLHRDYCA